MFALGSRSRRGTPESCDERCGVCSDGLALRPRTTCVCSFLLYNYVKCQRAGQQRATHQERAGATAVRYGHTCKHLSADHPPCYCVCSRRTLELPLQHAKRPLAKKQTHARYMHAHACHATTPGLMALKWGTPDMLTGTLSHSLTRCLTVTGALYWRKHFL